jgi:trigger factor
VQVTKEQIDPCKVALTVSVEPEKVRVARQKAFGQIAQNLALPGFRKGKVPPQIAKNYVDEGRVRQRAAEMLVEPAYAEAIEQEGVEPFGGPDLELVELNEEGPFVFKALVPLRPVVTLGPYKGLEIERRRIQVTDEDVDEQIEQIQSRQAEYEEIEDRAAQIGDIARADLTAQIEGQDTADLSTPREVFIEIGKNIPDLDNGLVGMTIGETRTIEALYPENFADENLRDKRASFTVSVKGLRVRRLPELNDEFAQNQKVDPAVNTVDELRAKVREGLENAANEMADSNLDNRLVRQIVTNSQIFYPDTLLREQMQEDARELTERLKRENATLDQFLEATGQTREQVEAQMAGSADQRIRTGLVLAEVAQSEQMTVDEADMEAEINERAGRAGVSPAAVRAFIEKQDQLEALQNRVLTQKVLRFLRDQAVVTDRVVSAEEMDALNTAENGAPAEGSDESEATATPSDSGTDATAEPLAMEGAAVPRRRRTGDAEVDTDADAETGAGAETSSAPASETNQ